MVYDVTKEKTFGNVKTWIESLKDQAEPDLVTMMVGNKIDLCEKNPQMRKVDKDEAMNFAHANNLLFEETSAITDQNVTEVFERLLLGSEKFPSCQFSFTLIEICTLKSKSRDNNKRNLVLNSNEKPNNNNSNSNCKFC